MDSSSFLVQDFLPCQVLIKSLKRLILSVGSRSCMAFVSMRMPRNVTEGDGPSVFCVATGIWRSLNVVRAICNACAASVVPGAPNNKSSR